MVGIEHFRVTGATSAIHGLAFHNSMRRQSEQVNEKLKPQTDASFDAEARRKAGARRTAWIVGAIAAGFFIASLLQGHFFHIPA